MSLDEFIQKWKGKKAEGDGAYAGQCVDLFRYYCDEVLGIKQPAGVWGAVNFWTDFDTDPVLSSNFTKVPNRPDLVPKKGWVAVWNFNAGGGYGHIAICTGENTGTQYFKSFDQNWSKISYCEIVNHNYNNVYGFLVPKGNNMEKMYTMKSGKQLDLSNEKSMMVACDVYDEVINQQLYVKKTEVNKMVDEQVKIKTAELSSKISDYEKQIENLNQQLENCANQPVPPAPPPKIFEEMLQQIKKMEDTGGKIVAYKEGQVSVEISYKKEK